LGIQALVVDINAEVEFPDASWKKHFVRGKATLERNQSKPAESHKFKYFIR
jgi:hypothetical protein